MSDLSTIDQFKARTKLCILDEWLTYEELRAKLQEEKYQEWLGEVCRSENIEGTSHVRDDEVIAEFPYYHLR